MSLWKLTPVDLTDPNWQASSHRGMAIVRAVNEEAARDVAAEAFDVATRFAPTKGQQAPPWRRPSLVRAEKIEDDRFESEGAPTVLVPAI